MYITLKVTEPNTIFVLGPSGGGPGEGYREL
jgi:hypothetical protein